MKTYFLILLQLKLYLLHINKVSNCMIPSAVILLSMITKGHPIKILYTKGKKESGYHTKMYIYL